MATHGMIDLETLGVNPDSVVLTVGAIKFDPFSNTEPHTPLYLRCDIEEQPKNLVSLMIIQWSGGVSNQTNRMKHLAIQNEY